MTPAERRKEQAQAKDNLKKEILEIVADPEGNLTELTRLLQSHFLSLMQGDNNELLDNEQKVQIGKVINTLLGKGKLHLD